MTGFPIPPTPAGKVHVWPGVARAQRAPALAPCASMTRRGAHTHTHARARTHTHTHKHTQFRCSASLMRIPAERESCGFPLLIECQGMTNPLDKYRNTGVRGGVIRRIGVCTHLALSTADGDAAGEQGWGFQALITFTNP